MTVAWYVHHHGAGHLHRALAVLAHLSTPTVVLSQLPAPATLPACATWVRLPPDMPDDVVGDVTAGGRLHWAPPRRREMRRWSAALLGALDRHDVTAMMSDVSVEATVLARTAGVPVLSMRQHGDRTDAAHALGYDLSAALIAPYPRWFEQPDLADDLRRRTRYVGGLCRLGRPTPDGAHGRGQRTVVVLLGSGGTDASVAHLERLAAASPWRWIGLGRADRAGSVQWRGFVDDPAPTLATADVVVSSAGHNSVMECAALGRPLVCVPEARPFDEQVARARLLAAHDLAVVVDDWTSLREAHVRRARRLGGARLAALADPAAAARTARLVEEVAA